MSCLTATLPAASSCAPAGSIQDILVLPSAEAVFGALGIALTNIGAGANTVTAINAALNWRRLNFDQDRPARAAAEQAAPGKNAYTHTVSFNISSDETTIEEALPELAGCCGVIALVRHNTGRDFLYGVNYSRETGVAKAGQMKAQLVGDTGEEVAADEVGSSITITSARISYYRIPLAAGVFDSVTVV